MVLASVLLMCLCAVTACKRQDNGRPTVLSTYPANGAAGVPVNTRIRVTFSEEMDTASAEAAFGITPVLAGTFEWTGNSMYFRPAQDFSAGTAYAFALETTAMDIAGNRLEFAGAVNFTTGDTAAPPVMVFMLGRSVMGGWFSHWGGSPYDRYRFTLEYHEVQPPPDIVTGIQAIIDSLTLCDQPVLFFKLCFVDFTGGDSATAQENLDRNLGYVEQVYDEARSCGLRMIVVNALPQLANATDPWLVWNHRQHNQRLLDLAAQHPDSLAVFDMYTVLSDANGNLKPAYASGPDDSHPNDAGYTALDATFFPLLEEHY